jgi:hypothetical protein
MCNSVLTTNTYVLIIPYYVWDESCPHTEYRNGDLHEEGEATAKKGFQGDRQGSGIDAFHIIHNFTTALIPAYSGPPFRYHHINWPSSIR